MDYFLKFLFIYLSVPGLSCGMWSLLLFFSVAACRTFSCSLQTLICSMWDLVPLPGIEPGPPTLGVWSLSPWTTGEVPHLYIRLLSLLLRRQREVSTCSSCIHSFLSVCHWGTFGDTLPWNATKLRYLGLADSSQIRFYLTDCYFARSH